MVPEWGRKQTQKQCTLESLGIFTVWNLNIIKHFSQKSHLLQIQCSLPLTGVWTQPKLRHCWYWPAQHFLQLGQGLAELHSCISHFATISAHEPFRIWHFWTKWQIVKQEVQMISEPSQYQNKNLFPCRSFMIAVSISWGNCPSLTEMTLRYSAKSECDQFLFWGSPLSDCLDK